MTEQLERLNPVQRAAAAAAAPVLVLAGAGSSKTETLIRRIAGLILGAEALDRLLCSRLLIEDRGGVLGLSCSITIVGQGDTYALLMQAAGLYDPKEAGLLQEAVSLLKNWLVDG